MNVYHELDLEPMRSEPAVWIRRVVIFERIEPEPEVIREINLSQGLNIVWAEEPENGDPSVEITGHSAGKTTFCRLLRYLLGEKTFANKARTKMIQEALPAGYVGAEMCVQGKWLAVIRPIGSARASYLKPDGTIEDVVKERPTSAYLEDYPTKTGLIAILKALQSKEIVRTGDKIEWGHILAWCTRDQEARFQHVHEWRSPKTESDWPNFRFTRSDPLFVMRTVLGLLLPEELQAEQDLAKLQKEFERLGREIEELKQEPLFRINLYESELRQQLLQLRPTETGLETMPVEDPDALLDLDHMATSVCEDLTRENGEIEERRAELQSQIDEASGRILHFEQELTTLEALFGVSEAEAGELDVGIEQREKRRKDLAQHADAKCPFGQVLINECQHVRALQSVLRLDEAQDKRALEAALSSQADARKQYEQQLYDIREQLATCGKERQKLRAQRNALVAAQTDKVEQARELKRCHQFLMAWRDKYKQGDAFPKLAGSRERLAQVQAKIEAAEQQLSTFLKEHDEKRLLLARIFSGSVKAVLASGTYDGLVSFDQRELSFRITHGAAMSGEAVETLTVLLGDVASLIYSTVNEDVSLPGFLIHDSPREADLGLRIYHSFIRFIASTAAHFGSPDSCPFQYILTTTTAPPRELQSPKFLKLILNAREPEGLLFKRDTSIPYEENQDTMFDSEEESVEK